MSRAGFETVPFAAEYAAVDKTTVRYWIQTKRIPAVRHGGIWFVDRRSLKKHAGGAGKAKKR